MMNDSHLKVEIKINKKTGKYRVTILDHGERVSCTEIDANGENINSKIVKYISEQMGNASGEPELTRMGERENRMASISKPSFNEEDEEKSSEKKIRNTEIY